MGGVYDSLVVGAFFQFEGIVADVLTLFFQFVDVAKNPFKIIGLPEAAYAIHSCGLDMVKPGNCRYRFICPYYLS